MKKIIFSTVAAILLSSASVAMAAPAAGNRIGVVSVQGIFTKSPKVQAEKAKLQKEFAAKKQELQTAIKSLDAMMSDYKKNASVMEASKKEKMQTQISAKQTSIMGMESHFQQAAAQAEQKAMSSFVAELQKAAAVVAKKDGLDMIIPMHSVVYASGKLDVTKQVQAAFNA